MVVLMIQVKLYEGNQQFEGENSLEPSDFSHAALGREIGTIDLDQWGRARRQGSFGEVVLIR